MKKIEQYGDISLQQWTNFVISEGAEKKRKMSLRIILPVLLIISSVVALVENSLAFLFFIAMWITLGLLLIRISFERKHRLNSVRIFFLFFTIYLVYMLITSYVYVQDPFSDFFYNPDSLKFYSRIDYLSQRGPWQDMYKWMSTEDYFIGDWKGFGMVIWSIAAMAHWLGENNGILIQKLQIVFFASVIVVYLYNLCVKYLDLSNARKATLAFGLLSHIMFMSGVFMRDIHMVFIYTIGFYIILSKWRAYNIFILMLLCLMAWQIRSHNGLFFMSFIALYGYLRVRSSQLFIANLLLGVIVLIAAGVVLTSKISAVSNTTDEMAEFQEYHNEKMQGDSGLTSLIAKAPSVVHPVLYIGLSQIYPFPVYRGMYVNYLGKYQFWLFPLCIAEIFWIFVWAYLIYGYYKREYRVFIPVKLKFALGLGILLIIAAGSTSYEFRRLVSVYPILFTSSAVIYYNLPMSKLKFVRKRVTLGYIALFVFYLGLSLLR